MTTLTFVIHCPVKLNILVFWILHLTKQTTNHSEFNSNMHNYSSYNCGRFFRIV